MKTILRLLIIAFCFEFCSCAHLYVSTSWKPENGTITENLNVDEKRYNSGIGLAGIIIPIIPTWFHNSGFTLEIKVPDTEDNECPVLTTSLGKYKGSYWKYYHSCAYFLSEEGNVVDGEIPATIQWKGETIPLTLSKHYDIHFNFWGM